MIVHWVKIYKSVYDYLSSVVREVLILYVVLFLLILHYVDVGSEED